MGGSGDLLIPTLHDFNTAWHYPLQSADGMPEPQSVHLDRVTGGHFHHCHSCWIASSGGTASEGSGAAYAVPKQPEATRNRPAQLP